MTISQIFKEEIDTLRRISSLQRAHFIEIYSSLFQIMDETKDDGGTSLESTLKHWYDNHFLQDDSEDWFMCIHKEFRQIDVFSEVSTRGYDQKYGIYRASICGNLDMVIWNLVHAEPRGTGILFEILKETFMKFKDQTS